MSMEERAWEVICDDCDEGHRLFSFKLTNDVPL